MNVFKYKDYEGTAEVDTSRGVCRGKILFIDDLVTYESDSPKGLQQEFEAAVDDYIATCKELGRQPQRPFRGMFNVRVPPELHRAAALRAVRDGRTLNEVVVRALDDFLNVRSDIKHNVESAIEGEPRLVQQTFQSVASDSIQWREPNVH